MNKSQNLYQYDKEFLKKELSYLHHSIFASPLSSQIESQYLDLHEYYFKSLNQSELQFLEKVIKKNLPLTPIEIATRKRFPILGKKINALLYLAEVNPEYKNFFSAQKSSRLNVFINLFIMAAEVPMNYIYGFFLVKMYGL